MHALRTPSRSRPVAALAALAAAATLSTLAPPARADDSDQDRALAAVQSGQVLPLKTILARLERDHPGRVLEVELEHEDGRWIYEIKLLQPGGRLVRLDLDGATAELLPRKASARAPSAPRIPSAP